MATTTKKKKAASKPSQSAQLSSTGDDDPLPISRYVSLTGTQAVLLMFSMLVLPRTTLTFEDLPLQSSSLDRPQAAWMAPLTAWPDRSVAWMAVGAAIVQSYWASKAVSWIEDDLSKETGVKREETRLQEGEHSVKNVIRAWGATLLGSVCFHALILILGAPITTHIRHTYALALLLSILSVYAPARCLTVPLFNGSAKDQTLRAKWSRLFTNLKAKSRAERALLYPSLIAVFGAWCGAYPLALDWDRPWQAWPLTPAAGAIIGYIVGSFASIFVSSVYYLARTLPDPRKTK
ncbi:hypothetical protein FRC19_006886 [Serendipita sp. 401]|nr:hypothetical protein FRC19_006886 [Serendipita sp. 401]KAG9022585.1 hypothetical protein FS842_006105 [Serendipita sp. 407]